ncbi:dihydrolipoyl dehydrogenase family protein [Xylanimonas sp. McL0601]|uniref:dihydrolipoyl dehydrogenase family protein n=1 Tax=Xylanimonas sp. McL0601 TaxID=3414739 RepID=UPI003CEEC725
MTQEQAGQAQVTQEYDVVVIGGGPVGENAVDRAARTGLKVALVEAELVGGECSYWACMPSKTLLRPGAALAAAAAVPGLAGQVEGMRVNPAAVLAWRDWMTGDWDDTGAADWVASAGITLVRGHGRLAGERLVQVDPPDDPSAEAPAGPLLLRARHAVIVSTGSVPMLPDTAGLDEAAPWSSREATSAEAVPESLVIIGGGVVASEMATAYADLGSHVTMLVRGGLLSNAEPFAGEAVAKSLRAMDVDLRLGVSVQKVERAEPGGPVTVTTSDGQSITAAELLVATGRVPRTMDVGVESVGLEPGRPLVVNDAMEVLGLPHHTEGRWLFACGDVTGRAQTTHQGKYEGRVAGDVVAARFGDQSTEGAPTRGDTPPAPGHAPRPWSRYAATADGVAATQAVFTRPQVAWVGFTERVAHQQGLPVRAVSYQLGNVSGASVTGRGYAGTCQIVVDTERRVIVGATFVGPDAAELLHAATIAVVGRVPIDRLWHAVPAYPTLSEVWLRFLEAYGM